MSYGFWMIAAAGQGEAPVSSWPSVQAMSFASKAISWWDFDGDATDLRAANDLTGTATYPAGLIAEKAQKTSRLLNTSALVPQNMTTSDGTGGIAFGGWTYINSTGAEDIEVRKGTGSNDQAYRLAVRNANQAYFITGSSGPLTISSSVGAVSSGSWHFLVGGIGAAARDAMLSVDGAATATGTASAGQMNNPNMISFGAYTGNVYTALHNDSSFLASCPLSPSEIGWLYNSGAGRGGAEVPQSAEGVWTWFNDPRAIALSSGRVVFGAVERDGTVALNWTDDSGWTYTRNAITSTATADDHDNPALLRRSDGKLMYFLARHNASAYIVGTSASVDDPSSFTTADIASQLGGGPYSYANPFQLTGEPGSPILNFFRSGVSTSWSVYYSRSTDGGATWTAAARLLDGAASGRPYLKAAQNGTDRIDFAVTDGHPDSVATNSIRHFYYENGAFYESDGTPLGTAPYSTSADLTTVYDGTTNRAWVHDIKIDSDGHPRIVFAVFPSTSDHRYYYARWTGSAWDVNEICTAGGYLYSAEPYYSGGVCLNSDDTNIVYASRQAANGRWAMYEYVTADGGSSFSETDLGFDGIRPFHIKGTDVLAVFNGRYVTYLNFSTRVGLMKL